MGTISSAAVIGSACAVAVGAVCALSAINQASAPLQASAPAAPIDAPDATRLAKQATFGPTQTLVDHITQVGLGGWLDEQFAAKTSSYADLAAMAVPDGYCSGKTGTDALNCNRDYRSSTLVAMRFYSDAMIGNDQLRQRVAWALSQLLVASDVDVRSTSGLATLNQIFLDNAFGNYRDVLSAVTLNPYMGGFLNLAGSDKAAPNENYARELMQLFSLGVVMLNPDGTPQLDASGAPIQTYGLSDVHEVARALTGWTYARLNGAPLTDTNQLDYSHPMIANPASYDTAAKTFLGRTVAAGTAQTDSLNAVIDAVFNHPNTAPFVSKFLIQQLVTSNPSATYVGRVAAVFANDGTGVRGNLQAVVRAILTDAEARGDARAGTADGKVKEPVLLATSVGRLIPLQTDGYAFVLRSTQWDQSPFRAPSVFNYYPPDYPLPQGGGLLSPSSKLITPSDVIGRHNLTFDLTVNGDAANRSDYAPNTSWSWATGTTPDWSQWEAFGTNTGGVLDRINLLMLNNTMTPAQRAALQAAMTAIGGTDANAARRRAQAALYVVASSPQFQVDR